MRAHLIPALALCAGAAAVAAPAAAQYAYDSPAYVVPATSYVEELIVTGPVRRDGPARLSQAVSYRDLDLRTRAGKDVLKWRIRDTARELCRALGEGPGDSSAIGGSCVDNAVSNARPQVRFAVARAWDRTYYASLDDRYVPY